MLQLAQLMRKPVLPSQCLPVKLVEMGEIFLVEEVVALLLLVEEEVEGHQHVLFLQGVGEVEEGPLLLQAGKGE